MDIMGLDSYLDLYKTQTDNTASKLTDQLDTDYSGKTEDELLDACKQFEAYFVEQMFKEMQKTVPTSESTSSYGAGMMDYYKDSMVQELAANTADSNSLGLAQMLYEQMKRNYGVSE